MNKNIFFKVLTMVLFLVSQKIFAEVSSQNLQVIPISHITQDQLNAIQQGDSDIAIELPADTQLPIILFLQGDIFRLIEKEGKMGTIQIQQTFYVRLNQGELNFSFDLVDWKPFFDAFKGRVSIECSIQNGLPSLSLGAQVDQKV